MTEPDEYRRTARAWLAANSPRTSSIDPTPDADGVARARAFMAAMYDAGYSGITWPKEWGGQGLTQAEERAFAAESRNFTLPTYVFSIGLGMCGPTLVDLGTDDQRRRYIKPLLRGEEIWCQLFSEPGAGSDVASLQTRAVRDGGEWVLNGQKVWTSVAHHADWGLIIARTNPEVPKHKGITMFIVDMHAQGVTVRPLRDMSGRAHFNEIFFDDVRIPDANRVGDVDNGWQCAVTTLLHERLSIAGGVGFSGQRENPTSFEALTAAAQREGTSSDPVVRDQLVEVYIRGRALNLFTARLAQETKAGVFPGARGSAAKLLLAEQTMWSAGVAANLTGLAAVAHDGEVNRLAGALIMAPGMALGGGTNEVMRNIIGERVLGLPKPPQVDRDVPFKDLKVGTQKQGV